MEDQTVNGAALGVAVDLWPDKFVGAFLDREPAVGPAVEALPKPAVLRPFANRDPAHGLASLVVMVGVLEAVGLPLAGPQLSALEQLASAHHAAGAVDLLRRHTPAVR